MTTYVIRVKGEKRGFIFYDYLEETRDDRRNNIGCRTIGCEKFKYAHEFASEEDAIEFKTEYDVGDCFDVVDRGAGEYQGGRVADHADAERRERAFEQGRQKQLGGDDRRQRRGDA